MVTYEIDSESTTSRFSGAPWYENTEKRTIRIYGAGGIGSHTALGISKIFRDSEVYIYDFDKVSISNMGGQLYNMLQCGQSKSKATVDTLLSLSSGSSNNYYYNSMDQYYSSTIFITALDNMNARKKVFNEVWKKNKGSNSLFVDARMSADTIQIIAFRLDERSKVTKYRRKYLFSDSEATHEVCSYKQTFFMGQMISGMIGAIVTNYLTHLSDDCFPQTVPFFTEFSSPLMKYTHVLE